MMPITDEREALKDQLWKEPGDSFLSRFTEDPMKSAFNINSKKREKLKKYIEAGKDMWN